MIVVTGGAGMIGANIVHGLNAIGHTDIVVVDDLTDGHKFRNISDADIMDYVDKDEFLRLLNSGRFTDCDVIFHQGACSSTTEWDGKFMMTINYEYSKILFHWSMDNGTKFVYASSASVYGNNICFSEQKKNENPLNVYAYSKRLFDEYVKGNHRQGMQPVIGLRYFNVFGPREAHKLSMASVAYHFFQQIQRGETVKLFGASGGVAAGEQSRDFIHVSDVVAVNLWAWKSGVSGIFNCGTGQARTFLDVARAVIAACGKGEIEFIDFPEHLKGRYQNFTQADIGRLRAAGFAGQFMSLEQGVDAYVAYLAGSNQE